MGSRGGGGGRAVGGGCFGVGLVAFGVSEHSREHYNLWSAYVIYFLTTRNIADAVVAQCMPAASINKFEATRNIAPIMWASCN